MASAGCTLIPHGRRRLRARLGRDLHADGRGASLHRRHAEELRRCEARLNPKPPRNATPHGLPLPVPSTPAPSTDTAGARGRGGQAEATWAPAQFGAHKQLTTVVACSVCAESHRHPQRLHLSHERLSLLADRLNDVLRSSSTPWNPPALVESS